MRKLGDLLKDLGFRPDASLDVQKAFVRHLMNHADRSAKTEPPPVQNVSKDPQLSFDSEILGVKPAEPRPAKRKSR